MEFKFRAVDDRTPPYLPPPSTISYFSEQALRANYLTAPSFQRNPRDFYTIQREIEKEKIRQEIIAEENIRRQVLEEELRRELMMEREMAMCRESEMGLPIEERLAMRLDSRYPIMRRFDNHWLEDRLAFAGIRGLGSGLDVLPHVFPQLSDAMTDENRTGLEAKNKDKLIRLVKPEPNHSGVKRKATTPPEGAGKLTFMSLEKKPEDWSCALCHVSATSEKGLNEHLRGRKHKAKEAALRAERLCNSYYASLSKKSGKRIKLAETRVTAETEMDVKVEEESLKTNKTKDGDSDQKIEEGKDLNNENDSPKRQKGNAVKQKENGVRTTRKKEKTAEYRKKFKFWCEICNVGAFSEVVVEAHNKGKKHMARLQKLNRNGEAASDTTTRTNFIPTAAIFASPGPTERAMDEDVGQVAAKEANEKTIESVTGDSVGEVLL